MFPLLSVSGDLRYSDVPLPSPRAQEGWESYYQQRPQHPPEGYQQYKDSIPRQQGLYPSPTREKPRDQEYHDAEPIYVNHTEIYRQRKQQQQYGAPSQRYGSPRRDEGRDGGRDSTRDPRDGSRDPRDFQHPEYSSPKNVKKTEQEPPRKPKQTYLTDPEWHPGQLDRSPETQVPPVLDRMNLQKTESYTPSQFQPPPLHYQEQIITPPKKGPAIQKKPFDYEEVILRRPQDMSKKNPMRHSYHEASYNKVPEKEENFDSDPYDWSSLKEQKKPHRQGYYDPNRDKYVIERVIPYEEESPYARVQKRRPHTTYGMPSYPQRDQYQYQPETDQPKRDANRYQPNQYWNRQDPRGAERQRPEQRHPGYAPQAGSNQYRPDQYKQRPDADRYRGPQPNLSQPYPYKPESGRFFPPPEVGPVQTSQNQSRPDQRRLHPQAPVDCDNQRLQHSWSEQVLSKPTSQYNPQYPPQEQKQYQVGPANRRPGLGESPRNSPAASLQEPLQRPDQLHQVPEMHGSRSEQYLPQSTESAYSTKADPRKQIPPPKPKRSNPDLYQPDRYNASYNQFLPGYETYQNWPVKEEKLPKQETNNDWEQKPIKSTQQKASKPPTAKPAEPKEWTYNVSYEPTSPTSPTSAHQPDVIPQGQRSWQQNYQQWQEYQARKTQDGIYDVPRKQPRSQPQSPTKSLPQEFRRDAETVTPLHSVIQQPYQTDSRSQGPEKSQYHYEKEQRSKPQDSYTVQSQNSYNQQLNKEFKKTSERVQDQRYPADQKQEYVPQPTNRRLDYSAPNKAANQKGFQKSQPTNQSQGQKPTNQSQPYSKGETGTFHTAPYRYDEPKQQVVQSLASAFKSAKAAFSEPDTDSVVTPGYLGLSGTLDPNHPFRDYDEKVQHKVHTHKSNASFQYDDHVLRSQQQYRSNLSQRKAQSESDVVLRRSRSLPRERIKSSESKSSPEVERSSSTRQSRKSESDSRKMIIADFSANKRFHSQEDVNAEEPKVNISELKLKLFGQDGEKLVMAKPDLEKILDPKQHKVASVKEQVFNVKDERVPRYYSHHYISRSEAGDDEVLVDYVSYKDGQQPKRTNINDILTDLEQTYEKLDLDNDELLTRAGHHEVGQEPGHRPLPPPPDSSQPNVKRLSITNLKKLEELQSRMEHPSFEYAKQWLTTDAPRPSVDEVFLDPGDKGQTHSPNSAEVSRLTSEREGRYGSPSQHQSRPSGGL